MKSWAIPETILVRNLSRPELAPEALPFLRYVSDCVLNDARMGHTPALLARLMRLFAACESAPGTAITSDDEDIARMVTIINEPNPQMQYAPMVAMQLGPYRDAILNAAAAAT